MNRRGLLFLFMLGMLVVTGERAQGQLRNSMRIAVIGDYGLAGPECLAVSELVHSWNPHYVVTVGDNNYPNGSAETIDENVGQYYFRYISPYRGTYGPGSVRNRFFPALGNHDWYTEGALPYFDYFDLPGNERYYDVRLGPLVHLFVLDTVTNDPDGVTEDSVQGQWLMSALKASNARFKFVVGHHAAYTSSSDHGPTEYMQWPFREWGADAVFMGHDHIFERVIVDDLVYIVEGRGGRSLYPMGPRIAGSQSVFVDDYGATLIEVDQNHAIIRGMTAGGAVLDTFWLSWQGIDYQEIDFIERGAVWSYLDDGSDQGVTWQEPSFDDSTWNVGPAELGYGDGDEETVISYGPDPGNRYITTYYRHRFDVSDPSFGELRARIMRDDGAVIYLNGVEVGRTGMPSGPVDYLTLANPGDTPQENSYYEIVIPASHLVQGENVVAVEVHQSSPVNEDTSFNFSLAARPAYPVLVDRGSTWRYSDAGIDPGVGWMENDFDASLWEQGPAQLGYGDGDEATVLEFGEDPDNKPITNYFRHEFTVSDPSSFSSLVMRILRDDGARVFLNGKEVYRSNLPMGEVETETLAMFAISGDDENEFLETMIPAGFLRAGTNVIAVEIHQNTATSSDTSFDLELLGL